MSMAQHPPHDWNTGVLGELKRWEDSGRFSPRIFHTPQPATESHESFTIHTRSGLRGVLGVLVPVNEVQDFKRHFAAFTDQRGIICLDNLIHLCMIVKDAGPEITDILEANLHWIDRWTVLDTGSTDGTPDRIRTFMHQKGLAPWGSLHFRTFDDFANSRNACLDIASATFPCTTYLMLDDSHVLKSTEQDPSSFRRLIISTLQDHSPTSINLVVRTGIETERAVGCITLQQHHQNIRYVYPVHECLDPRLNTKPVTVSCAVAYIDKVDTSSRNRRVRRQDWDLQMLMNMKEREPDEPRHVFYLAQTLRGMGRYDDAFIHYVSRAQNPTGDVQERVVSYLQLALLKERTASREEWKERVMPYYKACFDLDNRRPDALFHAAMHYYLHDDPFVAMKLLHSAFLIGHPRHCHIDLNPAISFLLVPFYLITVCMSPWEVRDGTNTNNIEPVHAQLLDAEYRRNLCAGAMRVYREWFGFRDGEYPQGGHPLRRNMARWGEVLDHIQALETGRTMLPKHLPTQNRQHHYPGRIAIVDDKGSAEGWVSMMALGLVDRGAEVWIFCKTPTIRVIRHLVTLVPIEGMWPSLVVYHFNSIILCGNEHYLPALYLTNCDSVIFMLRDTINPDSILVLDNKLKAIVPRSKWQLQQFREVFGTVDEIERTLTEPIIAKETPEVHPNPTIPTIPTHRLFVFTADACTSGTMKRVVSEVWSLILNAWPDARLVVWNAELSEEMRERFAESITFNTNPSDLDVWTRAQYWLYPNPEPEGFCETALVAASTRTLALVPDLGSLRELVPYGIVVEGDPRTKEWQQQTLAAIIDAEAHPAETAQVLDKALEWYTTQIPTWHEAAGELIMLGRR